MTISSVTSILHAPRGVNSIANLTSNDGDSAMSAAEDFRRHAAGLSTSLSASSAADFNRQMESIRSIKPLAVVLAEQEAARAKLHAASTVVAQILEQVRDFESSLDAGQEVAVHLVNFGQALTIRIKGVGYIEPAIVLFTGVNDAGEEVRLVQHVHQLSFLLWKAPRLHPDEPKTPIGFIPAP